ncbi:GtrA family protein [Rufibacter tibetensis]|uniref:GtrA/DPMS transmembrane domain-containing protein n=1 Tax=Rufibacter tibetensis TaxID=512763 RepID=A0A0P0CWY8_9BACT|nr:GtrA family protein [Rufibacter tibetensis]ALI99892.1 hypothetical protein DC20_14075 [Rufibacter tibetensis]
MKTFNPKRFFEVGRFVLVGGVCAGFDFACYAILVDYMHINYLAANIISTTLAIILNYFMSKKWVFNTSKYSFKYEFVSFVILSLIGLLLNLGLIIVFVERLHLDPLIGKLLAIGLVAVFNFVSKKKIVFGG